jgi:hypothetical protein
MPRMVMLMVKLLQEEKEKENRMNQNKSTKNG